MTGKCVINTIIVASRRLVVVVVVVVSSSKQQVLLNQGVTLVKHVMAMLSFHFCHRVQVKCSNSRAHHHRNTQVTKTMFLQTRGAKNQNHSPSISIEYQISTFPQRATYVEVGHERHEKSHLIVLVLPKYIKYQRSNRPEFGKVDHEQQPVQSREKFPLRVRSEFIKICRLNALKQILRF